MEAWVYGSHAIDQQHFLRSSTTPSNCATFTAMLVHEDCAFHSVSCTVARRYRAGTREALELSKSTSVQRTIPTSRKPKSTHGTALPLMPSPQTFTFFVALENCLRSMCICCHILVETNRCSNRSGCLWGWRECVYHRACFQECTKLLVIRITLLR